MKVLKSIINIINQKKTNVSTDGTSSNRIQNIGEGLETYVKDSFANTFTETSKEQKIKKYSETFSYGGGTNNPPDMILENGEAIEVKKIKGYGRIALNSSFPKDRLYRNDSTIAQECAKVDGGNWTSKNMFYYIGTIPEEDIECLFIVEGICYCSNKEIYSSIKNIIKNGVEEIPHVEFGETKELGRVNKVDPLGITNLRIRGMWDIDNPINVFSKQLDDIITKPNTNSSILYAIISTETYKSAEASDIQILQNLAQNNKLEMYSKQIQNPNNTAELIDVQIIKANLK